MSLVLDASVTLSWYFEDERTPKTDDVLEKVVDQGAVVPTLWRLEVANGFQSAIRRQRIDIVFRDNAFAALKALSITMDSDTETNAWAATLQLSDRFGLTAYDAAYVELAQRRQLPLASLDRELRQAGNTLGITLLGI